MISEKQANSVRTDFNPVTGDSLTSKIGNQDAYAKGWEALFGNKQPEKIPLEPVEGKWVAEEDKVAFVQKEIENSYKCDIVQQHFLDEPIPQGMIGEEL